MNRFIMRSTRTLAVTALLGSMAFAAQATEWNQLGAQSGWNGGTDAGASAETTRVASNANAGASGSAGVQIATAFQDLGMARPRAECYGKVLSSKLSPADQQQAAELVRGASSGKEVRLAVISSGPEIVGGFSAADVTCPEGMGG